MYKDFVTKFKFLYILELNSDFLTEQLPVKKLVNLPPV